MSALGAVWLLMEPSRKNGEMLHDARTRVARQLLRDPLFWFFVVLAVFSALVSLNSGMVRTFDAPQGKWIVTEAPCGFFPGCAQGCGFLPFAMVVALCVVVEGCRLALGKSARIAFAAVYAIAAGFCGIAAACFGFHSESEVFSPGISFGFALLASVVASAGIYECKWQKYLLLFAVAVGGCAVGLFCFSTPTVLLSFLALTLLFIIGSIVHLSLFWGGAEVAKFLVIIAVAAIIPALLATCVIPSEVAEAHSAVFLSLDTFPDCLFSEGFWDRRAALSGFAASFWRDEMWTGCGAGVFPLKLWISGGTAKGLSSAAPLNGWSLLLSERGILGAVSLAVPFLMMLYSLVHRAYIAIRFGKAVFFPLLALGVLAPVATAALGFVDPSVMRPDVILATFALFALAASSLPLPRLTGGDSGGKDK